MQAPSNADRYIHAIPGVGAAAHVLQGRELEILRVHVQQPALVLVDRGVKTVRTSQGLSVRARPGEALVLGGGQTVDFTNAVHEGDHYEARWLVFDPVLLDDPFYRGEAVGKAVSARAVTKVADGLTDAFGRATQALVHSLPAAVARQRLLEVMHWLLEAGVALSAPPAAANISCKVRALIGARPQQDWSAGRVAIELAVSQATLRRRLAAEGNSLTELLVDTRMATALTLLQATTQPVSHIALSVGYESPSRFAVRFRQRFGFAPTAVRGHERTL
ncbi:helix-turn-helix transcriptional regulator [Duganella dendranthematis]|uniref:Helix-turn-helix transcriptional regulator n=1 Tax=Duganella dendranthematis TaxID=2728021 RepID=A0ABX6M9J8_9BURK|nr:helix-turn-helix transcriptional regulator [Duganella dendranthematis]QJD90920.1 helix-turn-helix transcriptional regulator [Duganella dendranthematis]